MNLLVNDVRYHIDVCGEGVPLLLLHGFTGNSGTWTPFCDKWSNSSQLICPDLPGHGKTLMPNFPERYSIDNTSEDLRDILDQFEIEKANILGYSMGGRLALAFALTYPERVNKLILESSSPGLANEEEREARRMKDTELANFIKVHGMPAFVDYWESIPLFASLQAMPENIVKAVRRQRLQNSPEGLSNSLIGMGTGVQPSYWDRLSELEGEVLILAGSLDKKFCKIAGNMSQSIKSCKVVTFEEAGHAIHVEKSEKFGTIVSEFLSNT